VLGDFDPSGADAPEVYGREICALLPETINLKFTRLAMTEDDLARPKYAVAVRETKIKDPRAKKHVAKYGLMSSLELDAMAGRAAGNDPGGDRDARRWCKAQMRYGRRRSGTANG
jgi:hypothetical protein